MVPIRYCWHILRGVCGQSAVSYTHLDVYKRQQLPDEHFPNSQYGREYFQAHLPVRQQQEVVGHSVRAMYMLCGMADVALETGDVTLYQACRRLWARDVYKRQGAGTNYPIAGQLPRGTKVEVLDNLGEWLRIRAGSVSGYVSAQYLD